jgi:hypothetical protein
MTVRSCLVAALALACVTAFASASAATSDRRALAKPPRLQPMTFYVVKGTADSCGRGCDSWIEAEGKIESGTAARFKAFLRRLRDRNLPIYFASPGGSLEQAVEMGHTLHAGSTTARVGRTMVRECGFEAQDSEICIKLKQSGRELHGDLFTQGAICASACPYVLAGAAVHEVAPDAVLGVHSAKVVLNLRGLQVDPAVVAVANQRGHERADRMVAAYLAKMGIDAGLLGLARSVRFEDLHVLTREEIARFGLDRREFVETPWKFESNGLRTMHKVVIVRGAGETSFRLLQWRVVCFDANRFAVEFQRPASANVSSVSIAGLDAKPVYFIYPPVKASSFEHWGLAMARPTLQSLLDRPQAELTETSVAADGRRIPQTIKISNEGWAGALESLLVNCPPAKHPVIPASRSEKTVTK